MSPYRACQVSNSPISLYEALANHVKSLFSRVISAEVALFQVFSMRLAESLFLLLVTVGQVGEDRFGLTGMRERSEMLDDSGA